MELPRSLRLVAAGGSMAFAVAVGCGGDGSTGSLSGSGGSSGDVCKGIFTDQGTVCKNCLDQNCQGLEPACCRVAECEPIAKCARGQNCSGIDCYEAGGQPGPCRALIEDFGGKDGEGMKAALPLMECTAMHCAMECPK